MIEIEKQIQETELEQQALAAKASKQRIDLMDKIRVVMKINVFNHTIPENKDCKPSPIYLVVQWVRTSSKALQPDLYLLVDLLFSLMNLEWQEVMTSDFISMLTTCKAVGVCGKLGGHFSAECRLFTTKR